MMNKCICDKCPDRFKCFTNRNCELPSDVYHTIFTMLGLATSCWSNLESAGYFEANRAADIGKELCEFISSRVKTWKNI